MKNKISVWGLESPQSINDWINYLLVAYAFCVPISRAGIIFFAILVSLLWLVEGDLKNKFKSIIQNRFFQAVFALTIYLFITLLWSENLQYGFYHFKRLWYYIVIFVIFTSLKREYVKPMIGAFLISMFISEIISYGIFFEWWDFKRGTPDNPTPFMYHLEYSLFLAMSALVLLNQFIVSQNLKVKAFYAIFFMIATGNLFISAGRIGQLAFIVALFVLLILHIKNRIKAIVIFSFLSISLLSLAYNNSATFHKRVNLSVSDLQKIVNDKDYGSSWGFRVSTWIVTVEILQNNYFGVGLGDIKDEYIKIVKNDPDINNPSLVDLGLGGYHSDLLEVSAGGGYLAMMLFIYVFYLILKIPIRNRQIRNIKIMVFMIFTIGLIADLFLRLQFTMALFVLFVGISLRISQLEKEGRLMKF